MAPQMPVRDCVNPNRVGGAAGAAGAGADAGTPPVGPSLGMVMLGQGGSVATHNLPYLRLHPDSLTLSFRQWRPVTEEDMVFSV